MAQTLETEVGNQHKLWKSEFEFRFTSGAHVGQKLNREKKLINLLFPISGQLNICNCVAGS
ncbi:unnamed protein product [Meloidogyne enterolobii]|uniref:Uncharacterized protein n=2 Tax=Meloidogyne enterolobii TaxID=390850 RepID=A0ACB0XX80_MELEN|nr:unnamed protein product [Meloidogyne enterolobii]